MSSWIHVPPCPTGLWLGRGSAQPPITCSKAVSQRTSYALVRNTLANEREILNSPGISTMRGSGLHHRIGSPGLNHGEKPCPGGSLRRRGAQGAGRRGAPPRREQPVGRAQRAPDWREWRVAG